MPILPLKPNLYTIFNHHVSTSAQTFGLSESELHWIWPHGWLKAIYVQRTAEFHWFPYLLWLRVAISDSSQKMTFAAQENDGGCCCCCCCCLCRYSHDRLCKLCIRIHIYTYIYILYTLQHHRCESSITPHYRQWGFGSIIPFPFHQTPKNHALVFELLP